MALVNFSNLDFDQIKTTIKDYLRSNSSFTDYDFEGSTISTLIDVLAYNTYITYNNANMISNEVFLDSGTLRENVVGLARNIGYIPISVRSSRGSISFSIDLSNFQQSEIIHLFMYSLVCRAGLSFFGCFFDLFYFLLKNKGLGLNLSK